MYVRYEIAKVQNKSSTELYNNIINIQKDGLKNA